VIFEFGGHQGSLSRYVQVTKPIQETWLDRDPWELVRKLIHRMMTTNVPKTMTSVRSTLQADSLSRGRSTKQLLLEKWCFSNFKLSNSNASLGCSHKSLGLTGVDHRTSYTMISYLVSLVSWSSTVSFDMVLGDEPVGLRFRAKQDVRDPERAASRASCRG